MTKIEAVARTLCRLDGYDMDTPDKGRPMWMNYRDHARQIIEAIDGVENEGGDASKPYRQPPQFIRQ